MKKLFLCAVFLWAACLAGLIFCQDETNSDPAADTHDQNSFKALHLVNDSYVTGYILHETPTTYIVHIMHGSSDFIDTIKKNYVSGIKDAEMLLHRIAFERKMAFARYHGSETASQPGAVFAPAQTKLTSSGEIYLTEVKNLVLKAWDYINIVNSTLRKWSVAAVDYEHAYSEITKYEKEMAELNGRISRMVPPDEFARAHVKIMKSCELYAAGMRLLQNGFSSNNILIINDGKKKLDDANTFFYEYVELIDEDET